MEVEMRINFNGTKLWHKKDEIFYLHREDGPAQIYRDGSEYWWYHGTCYYYTKEMPLELFLGYCKWEYRKNGN